MATSREALNIHGEVVWRIPSLSFPESSSRMDIDEIRRYEAIQLFTERAGSARPGFMLNKKNVSVVTGICRCVSGIPLAIELAAIRIRHLGPETILERLGDHLRILTASDRTVPERQQTLKATIDWSYNLLSNQEKQLFNRMSVFTGDFSLEAAEDICSDEKLGKENIITLISQLVDKSLVNAENQEDESVRYEFLEPLKQYSLSKLIESGEEEKLRKLHLKYFIRLAELAYEEQSESQLKWLKKLEQEHDNFIAALNWSAIHYAEAFIRLSGTLTWFWLASSHIIMGKDFLERALLIDTGKSEGRARALYGLGSMLLYFNDSIRAIDLMNESLEIWSQFNNLLEQVIVLGEASLSYHSNKDHETGFKYSTQSIELARKIGKPGLINHSLVYVCQSHIFLKKFKEVTPLIEELGVSSEKLNQPMGIMGAYHLGGDCAVGTGNFKAAEKKYGLAIESAIKYGNMVHAGIDMQGIAFALSGQSRWAKSIRLDAAAREYSDQIGIKLDGIADFWDEFIDIYLKRARTEVGKELTEKFEEEGKNMGFEAAIDYALDFDRD
jgi:non-specific serine/threonine protein kinase